MIITIPADYEGVTEETTAEHLGNFEKLLTLALEKEYGDDIVINFREGALETEIKDHEFKDDLSYDDSIGDINYIIAKIWDEGSWAA
ncbi:hypothetical protein LCGC14_0405510 [marine sediment metagenome]|uniref:Uncharacterized protein n=1 Tax=marine sediment metagenome TaxID=412755 RepID=A0A0F9TDJ0_9ZZZZ|nr:hypothetical protein [archaeon]